MPQGKRTSITISACRGAAHGTYSSSLGFAPHLLELVPNSATLPYRVQAF